MSQFQTLLNQYMFKGEKDGTTLKKVYDSIFYQDWYIVVCPENEEKIFITEFQEQSCAFFFSDFQYALEWAHVHPTFLKEEQPSLIHIDKTEVEKFLLMIWKEIGNDGLVLFDDGQITIGENVPRIFQLTNRNFEKEIEISQLLN